MCKKEDVLSFMALGERETGNQNEAIYVCFRIVCSISDFPEGRTVTNTSEKTPLYNHHKANLSRGSSWL